jgi:flagellar biosynthesis protein FliR
LLIGFSCELVFTAVEFGGSLIDAQMGLSTGQTLDPMSGLSTTIVSRLLRWVAVVMFLGIGGHHMLLSALYQSFKLLPLGQPINFVGTVNELVALGGHVFIVGAQLAMPIILIIFFLDFSLGMISRVAPQVNVFQLGFEIKPTLGAIIFIMMIPFFLNYVAPLLETVIDQVLLIIRHLQLPLA